MARDRKELDNLLLGVLKAQGIENPERHLYFQPPSNIQMEYPCIIYARSNENAKFANNNPYLTYELYDITVIDYDPDSKIPNAVRDILGRYCSKGRSYTADNLNHTSLELYF